MQPGIGQGETVVSPLHMAMLVSAIANDGMLNKPYVIDHTINDNKDLVKQYSPEEYKQIFTDTECENLKSLMRSVVTDGTGTKLNTDMYTAYGKTGTAEYSDTSDGAHSWFVGFAEKDESKIAVAICLEKAGSGSEHAVPLAKDIFDAYFNN